MRRNILYITVASNYLAISLDMSCIDVIHGLDLNLSRGQRVVRRRRSLQR